MVGTRPTRCSVRRDLAVSIASNVLVISMIDSRVLEIRIRRLPSLCEAVFGHCDKNAPHQGKFQIELPGYSL